MISRSHLIDQLPTFGLLPGIREAFSLLNRREKVRAVLLIASMNVNALLGLVGLAGILPFVHLMLDPQPLAGSGFLARMLRAFGFVNVESAIYATGLAVIGLVVAKNIFAFSHSFFQNQFCAKAERRMAVDLLARVVHAPYVWIIPRNPTILRDLVVAQSIEWSRGVIRATLQLANELLFLCVALAFLIVATPFAGLAIGSVALLLGAILTRLAHRPINALAERKRQAIRIAGVIATEAISGARDVRVSGTGDQFVRAFADRMLDYTESDSRARSWQIVPRLGVEIIGFSVLVGMALVAFWSGIPRSEIAGLLTVYALVAMRAIPVVSQAAVSISTITGSLVAVREIQTLTCELPPPPERRPVLASVKPVWQRIDLDGVGFTYPNGERPALGPLSVSIECGKSYGIVGRSGAGKSTLVDLLSGLLPPTQGRILIDGMPPDRSRLDDWIDDIACVSQTPFLLDGSLQDNIEFGRVAVADREGRLRRAIEVAGLAELVAGLPHGVATGIGDRGLRLSGGQRQRVAIARALYTGARLLVLDEATSALDSLTEREVTEAIEALKGQMTLIVVAHRLSTVVRLDELIVLDAGQLAAQGPHQTLLGTNNLYRSLVQAQSLAEVAGSAA